MTGGFKFVLLAIAVLFVLKTVLGWRVLLAQRRSGDVQRKPSHTAFRSTQLLVVLLSTIALSAQTPAPSEMTGDRAHRDTAIHWPQAYDPSVAPVFSHNEILINTDCHRAFTRLSDATDWPNWFVLVKDVVDETPGAVQQGTLLHLKIFNTPIGSRITEFIPDQRISWVPFGADETEQKHSHFHAWHFMAEATGCRVITEETGIGANDIKDPTFASHFMHKAHDLWLASLKYTSEP